MLKIYQYKFNFNTSLFWVLYILTVTNYTIVGLNLDRTFVIMKPMKAYSQSKSKFWISIGLCWVLPLLVPTPYLLDDSVAECAKNCSYCWLPLDNVSLITTSFLDTFV